MISRGWKKSKGKLMLKSEIDIELSPEELANFGFEQLEKYHIRLKPAEREALKKPKYIKTSDWVEENRVLTMSSLPGPWRNIITPYLIDIMDASFYKSVEEIVICAAPQTGKSESVNNCIGYAIDRRPGSILCVYPDEQTARENSKDRIGAMIQSSAKLSEYMTGFDDDISFYRINLKNLQIYMGWARSAARLANKPLPYVVFDEIDKYPDTAGKKEASPISLGEKRTRIFNDYRKIWKLSTPTIEAGPIWTALSEINVRFNYYVKCPDCGEHQCLEFNEKQFRFPKDERDPEKIQSQNLAWIECLFCHSNWDDEKRNIAVSGGEWRTHEEKEDVEPMPIWEYIPNHQPKKIGFHIPAWLSRFVSIGEICAKFLKGTKNKTELKDFMNGYCALPWKEYSYSRKVETILKLRDNRPRGVVPSGGVVSAITAGVDTQDSGFWYEIRAWSYGIELKSWGIRTGFVLSWEDLETVLWGSEYKDPDNKSYIINIVIQDALGHRTAEVYNFALRHRGQMMPSAGRQKMASPYNFGNLEFYPASEKRISGGLKIMNVNTTHYKNYLANKLEIDAADPGAWLYDREFSEDHARQMTAEYIDDETGLWECPSGRANHLWDCAVLNLAAADFLGVKYLKKLDANGQKEKRRQKPKRSTSRW